MLGTKTPDELVTLGTRMLARAGVDSPQAEAEALIEHAIGGADTAARRARGAHVAPEIETAALSLLHRRAAREPLAYITGRCRFRALELVVDRRVLVPTEERTGTLVATALDLPARARVHEAGTGCGAVALAVKHERPDLVVSASDISSDALTVARENGRLLGLDVRFSCADGLPPGTYDLVLANLPYTDNQQLTQVLPPEEANFQPGVALWAGDDSLAIIRQLIGQAPAGTLLALEHAPHHTETMRRLLAEARTLRDRRGHERVTVGRAP